jgi:hypothetical protein
LFDLGGGVGDGHGGGRSDHFPRCNEAATFYIPTWRRMEETSRHILEPSIAAKQTKADSDQSALIIGAALYISFGFDHVRACAYFIEYSHQRRRPGGGVELKATVTRY